MVLVHILVKMEDMVEERADKEVSKVNQQRVTMHMHLVEVKQRLEEVEELTRIEVLHIMVLLVVLDKVEMDPHQEQVEAGGGWYGGRRWSL